MKMNKELSVNTTLSHYRIVSKLGEGGMGKVYLAQDTKLDRKVALKILPAELAANQDRMRRFKQEAKAAAALNHPYIAHVYEIGESGTNEGSGETPSQVVHFIAMEFVDGETLRELIYKRQIELAKLLTYLQQAAEGLAKAHTAGIVHRDLKPDNIMVTHDGHAKILDFGLAKLIEPQTGVSGAAGESSQVATAILQPHSVPGVILGTVGYMSPEQAQGKINEIDHRSDIFSFGCILYEAVTRRKAFAGKDAIDSLNKIIRKPVASISEFNAAAPAELQRLVRRCLAKDANERYQSIKDIAIELKEVQRDLKVEGLDIETRTVSDVQPTILSSEPATSGQSSGVSSPRASSAEYILSGIKQHRALTVIIGGLALIAITAAIIFVVTSLHPGNTEAAVKSIAVLPFVNENGNQDTEYLSDGISESLINSLSQLPGVKVIARSSSFQYKGTNVDVQEVAKALGVETILTGRVSQRGDNVQIGAELVNARDKSQMWGEQYNRKLTDVLVVQQEISREVSNKLRLKLSGEEQQHITKAYTQNPEAYELYLKGQYLIGKGTEEGFKKAIDYYQQAIDKDPNYALAYVGVSNASRALSGVLGFARPDATAPQIKAAIMKALEIDDTLAEAHAAFGAFKLDYEWDWAGAEREYKRSLQLKPNLSSAHSGYGTYLQSLGRFDEARAEREISRQLDPTSPFAIANVGYPLYYAHRFDQALEHYRKALELDPNYFWAHLWIGQVYVQQRKYPEAITEIKKAIDFSNGNIRAIATLGHAYAVAGKRSEALKVFAELQERAKQQYVSPYFIAVVYAGLGERDQVFAWLEKAFAERHPYLSLIKVEPVFDDLHSDSRFADLLRRIGIPG